MEEQLRRQAERLQVQNHKLVAATQERDRFFRNVSHELRTPMTSIIGFSELLLEDIQEPLTPIQRTRLEKVIGNAHKLLQMVNDLLDLSKVEAGQMPIDISRVHICELLDQIVGNMAPLAADKQLDIRIDARTICRS